MHEAPCCCDMGCSGWTCCCVSIPVAALGPFGGFCYFGSLASVYQADVEGQYGLESVTALSPKGSSSNGGSSGGSSKPGCCSRCCNAVFNAFTHSCSFFQIYMTLREMENERQVRAHPLGQQPASNAQQQQMQFQQQQQLQQQQQQLWQQQQFQQWQQQQLLQQQQGQGISPAVTSPVYAQAVAVDASR
jgi:hypothetical protein